MLSVIKEPLCNAISMLPAAVYSSVRQLMKARQKDDVVLYCDLKRYYKHTANHGEEAERCGKVVVFRRGYWDYEYFNVCFLNNVLSLCLETIMSGCIPRIEIMTSSGDNLWEEFFLQPYPDVLLEGMEKQYVDEKIGVRVPDWSVVFDEKLISYYSSLYSTLPLLNETANAYIGDEISQICGKGKVLGVLCRGTDYTETRPEGHPVQPSGEEILEKAIEIFEKNSYEYVYLATEDSRYDRMFRERFGDRLLTNRRHYYDEAFDEQAVTLIKDVHFDRENDDYLKGLEYLSSLKILSKCDGLVAGNCGGTLCAVIWNNNSYRDKYIFDLGCY